MLEIVDQNSNTFNDKNYLLGIFIDLSKAFDTVDHKILIKKLEHYGINGKNLSWFKNYWTNRKQYIQYGSINNNNDIKNNNGNNNDNNNNNNNNNENINSNFEKTELLNNIYGELQGSISRPLFFILYIHNLCFVSQFLKPIMFADDTNLFCSNKEKNLLFLKANL